MQAAIRDIAYHLPSRELTNAELAREFPDWGVEKIAKKTGIASRRIAADGECSSDLAAEAARALFARGACRPEDVDFLLLCTQSPDYFLPTTACLLQDRLGIPTSAGALDFNLGCSGYVYGLGLAKGLIETGQARRVLLITAETYSKFLDPADKGVRTIFGDGAAATLVAADDDDEPAIGPFVYGTDGRGAEKLIVRAGGMRRPRGGDAADFLVMDGPEIFAFTIAAVPRDGAATALGGRHRAGGRGPVRVPPGEPLHARAPAQHAGDPAREVPGLPPGLRQHGLLDHPHHPRSDARGGATPAGPDRHAGLLRRRILVGGRDDPMDGPRG